MGEEGQRNNFAYSVCIGGGGGWMGPRSPLPPSQEGPLGGHWPRGPSIYIYMYMLASLWIIESNNVEYV